MCNKGREGLQKPQREGVRAGADAPDRAKNREVIRGGPRP